MIFSNLQRLIVFSLSFLFFSVTVGYAQSEKFYSEIKKEEARGDNSSDKDAMDKLDKHPNAKDVHYFKMGNIAKVQKNGLFDFPSPITGKTIHAMTKRIEYKSATDYLWYGTVSDSILKGDMMLISEKGKIYGHLNYDNESYQIYGVGNGISVFVPSIKLKAGVRECTSDSKTPTGKLESPSNEVQIRTINGVCQNPTNVLILYTAAALAYDPNVVQTANSAFQLFQQALANSYVSIPNLTLAGVQQINSFNETSTPTYALSNDILTLVNNTEAQTLRNNANADIVITLTNGNYANTSAAYGVSSQIDADASHAFSIVEDYSAVTNYSLAHEIGHLYGGRHELNLDNTNTPVSYIHGYAFRHWTFWPFYHDYGTLMKTLENGRSRILNYSNPSVIVDSENAGALPYNNVSQRITDNVSRIAAFRGGAGPLSCSISGPYSISNSGCFPYNSDVTCGSAPYTYTWTVSSDGYNYYFSSSSASASVCVYPGSSYAASGNVYMRLQINSSDGQIAYAYFSSTVSNIHMIAPGNSGAGNNKFDGYILSEASPNPTNSISTISFSVPQKQNIRLELFNELGGSVQLLGEGEYETGEYAVSVNSDRLVSGIYFYKLTAGSFSQTKKLLVTK